jgi:hypothetical protein
VDTRNHQASGMRPNSPGKLLRWQTSTGNRARSWETAGEALPYTTGSGLLKPDKQETACSVNEDTCHRSHDFLDSPARNGCESDAPSFKPSVRTAGTSPEFIRHLCSSRMNQIPASGTQSASWVS